MKLLVIFAHPKEKSLNSSILHSVEEGAKKGHHELRLRNLYEMQFNPVLSKGELDHSDGKVAPDVLIEQEHITWADTLIFIYPIWWFDKPAILKGWIDRVFTFGFAYGPSPQGIKGLLSSKKALVFQTAGSNEEKFISVGGSGTLEIAMREGTLKYCGIEEIKISTFFSTFVKKKSEISDILTQVSAIIEGL